MEITASGPIRAKYLIKSKLVHHNHGPRYEMGPVIAHGDDGTENEGYHLASPHGECKMHYNREADPGLEVGEFYYFTFTPLEEKPEGHWWELLKRTESLCDVEFELQPMGQCRGTYSWDTKFEVTVDPQHTSADFGKPSGIFSLLVEKA